MEIKNRNFDHEPKDVPKALETTLNDLQLDYLDLYLIHFPVKEKKGFRFNDPERFVPADIPSTWKAMEALYDSGKVRAIGVSNFSIKKLEELLEVARVPLAVNQVERHPMWQQEKLHEFCRSKSIHLSLAGELGKSPAQVALRWGLQMGHSVLPKTSNEKRLKENMDEKIEKAVYLVHEASTGYKTLEELWDEQV
ncbi:NADPH-dependent aldo-keto reductase chloroplastic [Bienertia sinuspersici]